MKLLSNRKLSRGFIKGNLHGMTLLHAKLTTGLQHKLFRVHVNVNVVYVTKNAAGFCMTRAACTLEITCNSHKQKL